MANAIDYERSFANGNGEVIECSKPGYMKRFIFMPQHPHEAIDTINFLVETCGCSISYVSRFGETLARRRMTYGKSEQPKHPMEDIRNIHYCLPRDRAAMVFQVTAYYLGDKP